MFLKSTPFVPLIFIFDLEMSIYCTFKMIKVDLLMWFLLLLLLLRKALKAATFPGKRYNTKGTKGVPLMVPPQATSTGTV